MGKKGRPKSIANRMARRHIVQLNEKAEIYLRDLRKKRIEFDFSRYVNECILRDFGSESSDLSYIKFQVAQNSRKIDELQAENNKLSESADKIREQQKARLEKDNWVVK